MTALTDTSDFLRENPIGHTDVLLERARAGSETAWKEILRRYHTMLVFHVQAQIHGISADDLEEMLQRVLSKLVVEIRNFQYRGEGSFRGWISTLVVNECRNELAVRNQRRTETRELSELEDEAAAHSAELSDERRALLQTLGELELVERDVLIMRYFEKLSWDAIAEVLGCSIEKAKSLYERAFGHLSRRLRA